jgi:uncharacterized membrane protein YhhN
MKAINMKNTAISILYYSVGCICILLQDHTSFYPGFIAKALIIPLLMILFISNIKAIKTPMNSCMFAGLFFSWAGDVMLEFANNSTNMFILGLGSFLLAHVMYFIVFISTPGKNFIVTSRFLIIIPVIVYGLALVSFLYSDLGDMRVPVIAYAVVILTMLAGALNRKEKVTSQSYWLVLGGAVLFVISDSAIAINKFSHPFEFSGVVVMSTYIVAQYLIITGYIYQDRSDVPDQMR